MGFVTCSVTFLLQELRFPSYSTGRYFCCSGTRGAAEGIRVGSQWSLLALALPSSSAVLSFSRSHDVSRQQCSGETLPVRVLRPIIYGGLWVGAARAETRHVSCFVFPCQTARGVSRALYIPLTPDLPSQKAMMNANTVLCGPNLSVDRCLCMFTRSFFLTLLTRVAVNRRV